MKKFFIVLLCALITFPALSFEVDKKKEIETQAMLDSFFESGSFIKIIYEFTDDINEYIYINKSNISDITFRLYCSDENWYSDFNISLLKNNYYLTKNDINDYEYAIYLDKNKNLVIQELSKD